MLGLTQPFAWINILDVGADDACLSIGGNIRIESAIFCAKKYFAAAFYWRAMLG